MRLAWRLTVVCLWLLLAAPVLAQNGYPDATANPEHRLEDPRWYWNLNTGIVVPDDSLQANDAKLADVRIGKPLNGRWTLEVEYFRDEYDFDIDYGLRHRGLAVNFLQMNYEPLWNPYFLLGIGVIHHRSPQDSGRNGLLNVAIGGSWYLLGDNVRLRAEARLRMDLNDTGLPGQNGWGDGQFTLGLQVPLGD